jgi:predicted Zn-dependent peptidase
VERFTVRDVKRHFARFYGASNLILCVSGPVSARDVLRSARRRLGDLPAGVPAATSAPAEMTDGPRLAYVDSPGAQTAVQVLFRALPEPHPDYVALQALSRVLDDGMSTRLHYRLADQAGLAYYVNASIEPFHDSAQFEIDGAAAHAKFVDLLAGILGLLDELCDAAVSDKELAKAKRRHRLELRAAFDDVDAMAGWFGGTELFYPPPSYEEKVGRMEGVGPADIQRVARTVFRPDRLTVAAAGGLSPRQRRESERVVKDWRAARRTGRAWSTTRTRRAARRPAR